jgi:hypothetical protein
MKHLCNENHRRNKYLYKGRPKKKRYMRNLKVRRERKRREEGRRGRREGRKGIKREEIEREEGGREGYVGRSGGGGAILLLGVWQKLSQSFFYGKPPPGTKSSFFLPTSLPPFSLPHSLPPFSPSSLLPSLLPPLPSFPPLPLPLPPNFRFLGTPFTMLKYPLMLMRVLPPDSANM